MYRAKLQGGKGGHSGTLRGKLCLLKLCSIQQAKTAGNSFTGIPKGFTLRIKANLNATILFFVHTAVDKDVIMPSKAREERENEKNNYCL